tara:strand:- start:24 stop:686 length:663 start_codon:yes stop_codon:yes gene_type:complete
MKKTAIILGASGLTGSIVLEKLLNDDSYDTIKLFSRKRIDDLPSKVKQYTGDLLAIETFKKDFTGDDIFCCIGTTTKKTPNKTAYKAIDYGIPVAAASLAKANKINTLVVVSSIGANSKSNVFYTRTKGEMERDVLSKKVEYTYILRPSIIDGNRKEQRLGEKIGLNVFKIFQPLFFGKLKKYKITKAEHIAQAMISLANSNTNEIIINSKRIKEIALNK